MTANNLVVNANKTIALNISPNIRNNNDTRPYVLKGETVCSSNSAKYLGITIDNQLSFKIRITNLGSIIARTIGVTAKLSYCLTKYLNNFILFSCSFPFHLCLACLGSTHKMYLTKLQRLQNKALRIISKTRI